jgi:hypothetical protein
MSHSSLLSQRKKQLLGYWRSDAKKTLAELAKRKDISKERLEFFEILFGKLEVHYRPSTIVSGFRDTKKTYKYKILGADADSIIIQSDRKLPTSKITPQIQQIHFEGDSYWINLGDGTREFFERIDPASSSKKWSDIASSLRRWKGKRKG